MSTKVTGNNSKDSPLAIEYTVKLAKHVRGVPYKKRAVRAVRYIKAMGQRIMSTEKVLIDNELNKMIWSQGIRYLPRRMRIKFNRVVSENADAKNPTYTIAQYVPCVDFTNKLAEVISIE